MTNIWLLALLSLVEGAIAVGYMADDRWGLAMVWSCYAIANVGFMIA